MKNTHNTISMFRRGRGRLGFSAALAASALLLVGAVSGYSQAAMEADKLLAMAKTKQEAAQQRRTDANAKLQAAADDDAQANALDREAKLLTARALQLVKADKNKERAFALRNLSTQSWAEANRKWVQERNDGLKAAQHKHDADELLKAAAQVKDQPGVAATLEAEAKTELAQATQAEQEGAALGAQAEQAAHRGQAEWAEAAQLDGTTHGKLAAKPARVVVAPVAHK